MLLFSSYVKHFATPWSSACQASLSITISQSLLKLMSNESVMPSNHLILCCPLLLLPSIFLSIRVFSSESALHIRWQKYWSFSFSISPSNEYSGLISFRIDWFDLLAVHRTLKSLLQHHSLKASILCCLHFFSPTVISVHDYWKNHSFDYLGLCWQWYLFFKTLSRFDLAILLRRKHLLISWLQSPFTLILEPKKMKSDIVSTFSPSIHHEVIWLDAMILVFWMLSFRSAFSLSSFTFIKKLISQPLQFTYFDQTK